ncbi:putative nuclease HARBI1 isoform X2 [Temnothorax curvispinosus]|uniref:Nuclease HARBI1 isoform X2 n=1 Tax=Temnothorax curvispinosus TaxID=300111 RepID=A0A6J1QPP7_9HYME|nr:putative nuclease HARBI1 isoform X2 [Temnothorax curvispinosus]
MFRIHLRSQKTNFGVFTDYPGKLYKFSSMTFVPYCLPREDVMQLLFNYKYETYVVLSALNFIASGSYQKRVGQDYLSCMSQPTISKILRKVVNALNILMEQWIKFPIEENEIQRVKETYWTRTQFPGIIGAIDGTHVAIVSPNVEREHLYINRKLYHSLNVLLNARRKSLEGISRIQSSGRDVCYKAKRCLAFRR